MRESLFTLPIGPSPIVLQHLLRSFLSALETVTNEIKLREIERVASNSCMKGKKTPKTLSG